VSEVVITAATKMYFLHSKKRHVLTTTTTNIYTFLGLPCCKCKDGADTLHITNHRVVITKTRLRPDPYTITYSAWLRDVSSLMVGSDRRAPPDPTTFFNKPLCYKSCGGSDTQYDLVTFGDSGGLQAAVFVNESKMDEVRIGFINASKSFKMK